MASAAAAASSSGWLDAALAQAGIGHSVDLTALTGQPAGTSIDQAVARVGANTTLGGAIDSFRSLLTWTGSLAIGAELLLGLGLLVFLVWIVRKGVMEIIS